jgi:D-alanyl-D-alanine carboxypeptidase (penicillin-binding protein 5/6)
MITSELKRSSFAAVACFRSRPLPSFVPRHASSLLAGLLLASALAPATASAHPHRRVHAGAHARSLIDTLTGGEPKSTAIVMDAGTGEILYSERADSPRYPASVTKIMTMYLAFQALADGRLHLGDMIVVSPLAAAQPATKLGLRAGETISVEDALHAMAVHSANDMAVAIAEKVGGTSSRFADMMTLKAQQLGMTGTHYVNPNGLPDNRQISTAHDLAILARAALRDYPQYYGFFSQEQFTYRGKTMVNTNHLLGKMPGVDGLKTGFTNAAGFNLAASAVRNGHRLIAVVMGSSSGAARNANVEDLLLTGFDIEDRRDRGEKILATQTFFQGLAGVRGGRFGLGGQDAKGDPIDVVLTRTSVQPGTMTVSNTMPGQAPGGRTLEVSQAMRVRQAPSWWVQVGEFRTRQAARAQIAAVSRSFASLLKVGESSVDGARRAYKARFHGLTEAAAKQACFAVRNRGIPCVTGDRA